MILKRLITFVFIFITAIFTLQAQKNGEFEELIQYEDSLRDIAPEILNGFYDFNRYEASEKFYQTLTDALGLKNSYKYPFDSLKSISILRAPDNFFRIFTWNLMKADGSYDYFGLLQLNPKKTSNNEIYKLVNIQKKDRGAEYETHTAENWFGAHYYKMIKTKSKDQTYYTLLGWDGNNNITTRKIIDVIVFNGSDEPEFGAPVFQTHDNLKNRFIIEYGSHVSVSLKYEKQFVYHGKQKKWMIVFDRVSPLSPMLEGQYQFYVPETDTYDAFIFENGVWQFYQDVDARNPKGKKKNKDKDNKKE